VKLKWQCVVCLISAESQGEIQGHCALLRTSEQTLLK